MRLRVARVAVMATDPVAAVMVTVPVPVVKATTRVPAVTTRAPVVLAPALPQAKVATRAAVQHVQHGQALTIVVVPVRSVQLVHQC
jgi:hypothetical protein